LGCAKKDKSLFILFPEDKSCALSGRSTG